MLYSKIKNFFNAIRAWYWNIWRDRKGLRNGRWKAYYCDRWCLITDGHFCHKPIKRIPPTPPEPILQDFSTPSEWTDTERFEIEQKINELKTSL